jgi:hypothetical protein
MHQIVDREAAEIGALARRGVEAWIEAGRRLLSKKAAIGHGGFGRWISSSRLSASLAAPPSEKATARHD